MANKIANVSEFAGQLDEIREIEATELELREDLVGSLFSCCCPCGPIGYPTGNA